MKKLKTKPHISKPAAAVAAAFILGMTPMVSGAATNQKPIGYVSTTSGDIAKTNYGECVRTVRWKPDMAVPGCAGYVATARTEVMPVKEAQPVQPVVMTDTKPEAEPMSYTLDTETYFDFDKAELRPQGKKELDRIAERIGNDTKITTIEVVGYTDRIGSESYNLDLSKQRARAVSKYLQENAGINRDKFIVVGAGESRLVDQKCENIESDNKLIQCLQPNRRVEVTIEAKQMETATR